MFYQTYINTRSTHIEGDNLVNAALLSNISRPNHSRTRTGYSRLDRAVNSFRNGDHRAVRLGNIGSYRDPGLLNRVLKIVNIRLHHGAQVGVQNRCAHS